MLEDLQKQEKKSSQFWAYDNQFKNKSKKNTIVLLDNVQFIYELSMAELELQKFGVEYQKTNGLREIEVLNPSSMLKKTILKKGSYYKYFNGDFSDYYHLIQQNQTRSVNQYLTHWIYPYKGKFHPQMIRALINIIGLKSGEKLLDPFAGSGTTALEAKLLGINYLGIDVSPLCALLGRVKTESFNSLLDIEELKTDVFQNILSVLNDPKKFYQFIDSLTDCQLARDFYTIVRLVSISDFKRRRKNLGVSFLKNLDLMLTSIRALKEISESLGLDLGDTKTEIGDSRDLIISDDSIDGVITSPPYSIALDYIQNDSHSLNDLNYEISGLRENFIGVRGVGRKKISLYNDDMKKSFSEIHRVLKPNKNAVIVIGNATFQGKQVKTVEFTIKYMENNGFRLVRNIDKIIFGLYNVMKKENILIFKKMG